MARERLLMGTDNLIELTGLRNRRTGLYPDDAVVEADLLTAAGAAVAGGADLPVEYEDDTTGIRTTYYGVVPYSVTLTEDAEYIVRTVAIVDGVRRSFDTRCIAVRG